MIAQTIADPAEMIIDTKDKLVNPFFMRLSTNRLAHKFKSRSMHHR